MTFWRCVGLLFFIAVIAATAGFALDAVWMNPIAHMSENFVIMIRIFFSVIIICMAFIAMLVAPSFFEEKEGNKERPPWTS